MKYDKEELTKSVEEQLKAGMSERDILNRLSEAGLEPIDARLLYIKVNTLLQEAGIETPRQTRRNRYILFSFLACLVFAMIAFAYWQIHVKGVPWWEFILRVLFSPK